MRAKFVEELVVQDFYVLKGEEAHHLLNVVRIESNEELLLLNGKGLKVFCQVDALSKKEVHLKALSSEYCQRGHDSSLALGMPKRDALELCLKEAVELGHSKIYLVRSTYSQMKSLDPDRERALLVSALEQSNAPFLPEIHLAKWETIPWSEFSQVILLDSQMEGGQKLLGTKGPRLLVVGPEGGFSPEERKFFQHIPRLSPQRLPTPILRTPTAVAVGTGLMLQTLLD